MSLAGTSRYFTAVQHLGLLAAPCRRLETWRSSEWIVVEDLGRAIDFFRELGFELEGRAIMANASEADPDRVARLRRLHRFAAREDVAFCPGFLRGRLFVGNYAIVALSLPRRGRFITWKP